MAIKIGQEFKSITSMKYITIHGSDNGLPEGRVVSFTDHRVSLKTLSRNIFSITVDQFYTNNKFRNN